jgi:2-polyprenyl-3-methyl-5-hydroxy-6-metoxy-1,4-benzoquinol methylase
MPDPACLVCGTRVFRPHFEILLRCAGCGFVTARQDAPFDPKAIYDESYYHGASYLDYPGDAPLHRKNFRRRLDSLLRRAPGGRLLEIGSAYGYFLELARERFDVVGFEISEASAREARERLGLDVRTGDLLDAPDSSLSPPFDAIVMWDVVEHLERPDLVLDRIARLSRPGTLLCLTTGDVGSRVARFRRRKWRLVCPPFHLHYFDRTTIARLLADRGFRVVELTTEGVSRSIRQALWSVLALALRLPGLCRRVEPLFPADAGFTIDLGDIMKVTAIFDPSAAPGTPRDR